MTTARIRKQDRNDGPVAGADHVVATVAEVSSQAGERLSGMASGAGDVVRDAERGLRESSDQRLGILGGVALGFASGLLFAGAHRLLVILSLLPLAMVALAAIERLDRETDRGRPRSDQARLGN